MGINVQPQVAPLVPPIHVNRQPNRLLDRVRQVAIRIITNYGRAFKEALKQAFSFLISVPIIVITVRIALAFPSGYVLTAFVVLQVAIFTFTAVVVFIREIRRPILFQQPGVPIQPGVRVQPRIPMQPQVQLPNGVVDEQLNLSHLQIPDIQIDMSQVPATIKVRQLVDFFDNIQQGLNFDKPNEAGYVNLGRERSNDGGQLTQHKLRTNLETLVANIENRRAVLGTPSRGTPQLEQFYTTLENFIRFSIHHRLKEINSLPERPSKKPPKEQSQEAFKKYDIALQGLTRMVVDLGLTAEACGARWMSEARYMYSNAVGVSQGSLEERVKGLLARERELIAQAIIAEAGRLGRVDTHYAAAFYAALGGRLGLIGSQGVVEHLQPLTQRKQVELLTNFYNRYNSNLIRATIQNAYKLGDNPQSRSGDFRELMLDWFKEQVGDWKLEEYKGKTKEVMEGMRALKNSSQVIAPIPLTPLRAIIQKLKETDSIVLRSNQVIIRRDNQEVVYATFQEFLTEVLTLDQIKGVVVENLQGTQPPAFLIHGWKQSLISQGSLQENLYQYVRDSISQVVQPNEQLLNQKWHEIKEKSQIIRVFQEADIGVSDVSTNLLKAFREGSDDLQKLVEAFVNQDRKNAYLKEILQEPDEPENNEVPPLKEELLDRFLFRHNIFLYY